MFLAPPALSLRRDLLGGRSSDVGIDIPFQPAEQISQRLLLRPLHHRLVSIRAYACQAGRPVTGLVDPSGGHFDSAGDFDRLIPADARSPLLSQVDPYGDLELARDLMPGLITEISALLSQAHTGPESRGLLRLRALAEACAATPDTTLVFRGD